MDQCCCFAFFGPSVPWKKIHLPYRRGPVVVVVATTPLPHPRERFESGSIGPDPRPSITNGAIHPLVDGGQIPNVPTVTIVVLRGRRWCCSNIHWRSVRGRGQGPSSPYCYSNNIGRSIVAIPHGDRSQTRRTLSSRT